MEQGILIDLDCLLDTRLGTLELMEEGCYPRLFSQGYQSRLVDEFEGFDKETFKKKYAKRDVATLQKSKLTNIFPLLELTIQEVLTQLGCNPVYTTSKLYINTYPYDLNDEEEEAIQDIVRMYTNCILPIEFVFLSNGQLTVEWVDKHVFCIFKYDFNDWLTAQIQNFNKKQVNHVRLMVPALYVDKKPDLNDKDVKETLQAIAATGAKNFFDATEHLAKPWVDLNFIDVTYFSIFDPATVDRIQRGPLPEEEAAKVDTPVKK